ncbi:glutamine-hydrolyzing carbamoyl-phosphate synthase small subunit [Zavarzinia sp. CC-PAN008]|uniref:glutamine-hydrolyzing carbamoyl-phosphate synthase small subunit n=1 Tax=Zavarzinia sp. CC-PAN008 TaxID=3243332 RepID=UPI003F7426EC
MTLHKPSQPASGPAEESRAPGRAADEAQEGATGVLVLGDGSVFWGQGVGAEGSAVGELCFNTSMTGYQEILTDPSYAGQIITFTFPHIGNVGVNDEDVETVTPAARGCVLRCPISEPSNWRAAESLERWLDLRGLVGIAGVDTRRITRLIRDGGAPNAVVAHSKAGRFDLEALTAQAQGWPGLEGMDLAKTVSRTQTMTWDGGLWSLGQGYATQGDAWCHVVAVDYGVKHNILRSLAAIGARVTVVPATATAEEILALKPDGVFLSNGPGDPAATGVYAVPTIQGIVASGVPTFGICLGHQMLALSLGAATRKMERGHRGANHPVKDLQTGKVEITSQNHGFVVDEASLPPIAEVTHVSLFDGTNEGFRLTDKPVFSVQHHPEASPGPEDSHYLFHRFADLIRQTMGKRS